MKCHRYFDRDLKCWLHIPGCIGAAENGPDQCTCDWTPSQKELNWKRELDEANRVIASMCDRYNRLVRKFNEVAKAARCRGHECP